MPSSADEKSWSQKELCFLVGAPRSGTTWFQRLLQQHPRICGGEESYFFTLFGHPLKEAASMFEKSGGRVGPLIYMDASSYEAQFKIMWNAIFAKLYGESPHSTVHLEKTPHHCLVLNEVVQLFPNARLIILLRDSRAVTSSMVHAAGRSWGDYWAPKSYKEAAVLWYVYMKAVQSWRASHPSQPCLVLRYEDAIKEPREAVRRALQFMNLDDGDQIIARMLEDYERNAAKRSDPPEFNRKRGSVGWQQDMPLYGKLVTWRYTRKMMQQFGYTCRPFG